MTMKTDRRSQLLGRLLVGIAAAGLVLALAACGSGSGSGSNGNQPGASSGY
jgi:hypothetical protein